MKKAALFLTSLVSLSLALSACQPADEKITDPRQENFRGYNKSKGGQQGNLRVGFYALSSLMMEKEVEAIQLLRLALNVDDASSAGYKIGASEGGALTLTSDSAPKEFNTDQGSFKTSLRKTYSVSALGEKVSVIGSNLNQSVDRLDRKNFLNYRENTFSLQVENSQVVPTQLVLTLETKSSWVMGEETKKTAPENLNVKIVLTVDRDSLKTSVVKILTAQYTMNIQRARPTTVSLAGENHEVHVNGQCYALTGQATILSDKAQKKIAYADGNVEVLGSSYKASAAECESRPTVDLSRLFIY
jgi:ATP-dependent Clp protease adapter protein ClpS